MFVKKFQLCLSFVYFVASSFTIRILISNTCTQRSTFANFSSDTASELYKSAFSAAQDFFRCAKNASLLSSKTNAASVFLITPWLDQISYGTDKTYVRPRSRTPCWTDCSCSFLELKFLTTHSACCWTTTSLATVTSESGFRDSVNGSMTEPTTSDSYGYVFRCPVLWNTGKPRPTSWLVHHRPFCYTLESYK